MCSSDLDTQHIIVYSCQDSPILSEKIFTDPRVLYVFDHLRLTDIIKNQPYYLYHHNRSKYLLYKQQKREMDMQQITDMEPYANEYNTKCIAALTTIPIYTSLKQTNLKLLKDRNYDVIFVGTLGYDGGPEIEEMRKFAHTQIQEICNRRGWKTVTGVFLKRHTYLDIISDTKIFVSPFGWGEFSLKDYECVVRGCHLLKPDIYYEDCPDIYKNSDSYNYTNLEHTISNCLSNIEDTQKKVDCNQQLLSSFV